MRADASAYALQSPATLAEALALLADATGGAPGATRAALTPLAGGTELMVAFNAGRLPSRSFLSLHRIAELRFIEESVDALTLGATTTFTDIRRSPAVCSGWPLLAQSASWTGSVANQNRATLGGNLCNGSPAADTPPVLLAYNASVRLVSAAGSRTLAYDDFHLGYKTNALRPGELLHSIIIPRPHPDAVQFVRKVGTRNAQAISKVALAAVATRALKPSPTDSVQPPHLVSIRIAAASLADRPLRATATEAVLRDRPLDAAQIARARAAFIAECRPIDDIRSTAAYRTAVAANLLEHFLRQL